MKPHGLLIALCLLATGAAAQEGAPKRPITHEDVWLMKRVGAPALSPDGRMVVVAVAEPAYEDAAKSSDLWLVPADGSAPPFRAGSSSAGLCAPPR